VVGDTWRDASGFQPEGYIPIAPFCFFGDGTWADKHIFPLCSKYCDSLMSKTVDHVLPHFADFLENIHTLFYQENSISLLEAIQIATSEVLDGLNICIGTIEDSSNNSADFMGYLAKFGARTFSEFESCCTHLVVGSKKDPGISVASNYNGVHIVSFEWLIESCICYKKMDESLFSVPGVKSPTNGPMELDNPLPDREVSSSELIFDSSGAGLSQECSFSEDEEEDSEIQYNDD
jgi:hypothetical protein